MAVGPIPWTAINDWAEKHNMGKTETEEFFFMIESLDAVFLQESQPKGKMAVKDKR